MNLKDYEYYKTSDGSIYNGDALSSLRLLPDESIHCCVTSPPYWGLRDYGIEGQLGLEKTPEEYIKKMVNIFREVRRVIRKDGTLWLNLGDSYFRSLKGSGGTGDLSQKQNSNLGANFAVGGKRVEWEKHPTLKPKDLCGIPWRTALALQADGWWLRSDIIWHKPNPMPESVTDRPTKAHEYIFLLTKSPKYFYDVEAVKEDNQDSYNAKRGAIKHRFKTQSAINTQTVNKEKMTKYATQGRNKRTVWTVEEKERFADDLCNEFRAYGIDEDIIQQCLLNALVIQPSFKSGVWTIPTHPFPAAHFATFPPALVEPCILAGTSEKGCCAECGSPWERVVERIAKNHISRQDRQIATGGVITGGVGKNFPEVKSKTTGWQPTCSCNADTKPCIVLDPFGGAMTTAIVAHRLGRKFIMIELSKKYIDEIGIPRIEKQTKQLKLFN